MKCQPSPLWRQVVPLLAVIRCAEIRTNPGIADIDIHFAPVVIYERSVPAGKRSREKTEPRDRPWQRGITVKVNMNRAPLIRTMLAMLLALLGAALWQGAARADYVPNAPVVVSMGDSYSACEGVSPFYGWGEGYANQDWLAHRSENSWPGQLAFPGLSGKLRDHRG